MSPFLRLTVAWATLFVVGTDLFVMSPLLPLLAADYRVSVAIAAWSVSVFSLGYMIAAPLIGHIADRIGRRHMLISGLLGFALANALTAAAPAFPGLLAARVLAGLATAGVTPSIYAILGGTAPPERRATWLSIAVSGLLLALTTGAPLGALAGAAYGWPSVFAALTVLSLLAVPANRFAWPADRSAAAAAAGAAGNAALAARLLCTVAWATALYAVYTYLGAGLIAAGFSTPGVARVLVWYGLGALAGTIIGGRLADGIGTRATAVIGLAGLAAAFLGLRALFGGGAASELQAALGFALASVLAQLFFPAQQAALAADFPARRATALAWNNSALFFGISLSAILGGWVFTAAGFAALLGAAGVLAALGAGAVRAVFPGRP